MMHFGQTLPGIREVKICRLLATGNQEDIHFTVCVHSDKIRLDICGKYFLFPIGRPAKVTPERIAKSFHIEMHPTYGGFLASFLCYMDHKIPLEEIMNTSQEELNEKYFDKQFEKRYPHRVEKSKPAKKAKAKRVTERLPNYMKEPYAEELDRLESRAGIHKVPMGKIPKRKENCKPCEKKKKKS